MKISVNSKCRDIAAHVMEALNFMNQRCVSANVNTIEFHENHAKFYVNSCVSTIEFHENASDYTLTDSVEISLHTLWKL